MQEIVLANPKGVDGYVNGKHASMETAPNSQGVNAVKEGRSTFVTDKWGANHGDINSGTLNSNWGEQGSVYSCWACDR